MYDYLISALIIIGQIVLFYFFGTALFYKEKSIPYRFILGFIVYSVIVAALGISVQVLNLPWMCFFIAMIILLFLMILVSIILIRKRHIAIFPMGFKNFIKNHWVIFLVTFLITAFLFLYYLTFWYNNHLDDGYYINKMITMPYVENPFSVNPSSGFLNGTGINAYIVNTAEIEASFYLYLTQVSPTLYIRVFMSFLNYFVFANLIFVFTEKIIKGMKYKIATSLVQFSTVIMILFGINSVFLETTNFLYLPDLNQYTSAMYYGSSIVRVMGILFLIVPFLDKDKIDFKMIISVMGISLMLISKSTIALPLIIIVSLSYLLMNFMFGKRNEKIIAIVLIGGLIILGAILPGNYDMQEYGKWKFLWSAGSYYVLFSSFVCIISLLNKSRIVAKLTTLFIIIISFIFINPLNNITETSAVYVFVMGRFTATFFYTVMVLGFIYLLLFVARRMSTRVVKCIYSIVLSGMVIGTLVVFELHGGDLFLPNKSGDIFYSLKVMKNNNDFIPKSTVMLGNKLESLSKKEGQLFVMMEELSVVDNTLHPIATTIRSYAPSIKSVSATIRYPIESENDFSNYNAEDQLAFQNFISNLSEETFNDFSSVLERYPINCVVLPTYGYHEYMNRLGFELFDFVSDQNAGVNYYIYFI